MFTFYVDNMHFKAYDVFSMIGYKSQLKKKREQKKKQPKQTKQNQCDFFAKK